MNKSQPEFEIIVIILWTFGEVTFLIFFFFWREDWNLDFRSWPLQVIYLFIYLFIFYFLFICFFFFWGGVGGDGDEGVVLTYMLQHLFSV